MKSARLFAVAFLLSVVLAMAMTAPAHAAVTTITPSSADTYIYEGAPTSNYGTDTALSVLASTSYLMRSLVKFDLSSIPSGSIIGSASLQLYYFQGINNLPEGRTYTANRVTTSWVEGNGNGGGTTGATWNKPDMSQGATWTTAGGDFTITGAASQTVPAYQGYMTWTVTDIVKAWVEGGQPDYGFLIKDLNEGDNVGARFYSREEGSNMPILQIDYTAVVAGLAGFTDQSTGNVLMVIGDLALNPHGSKPSGVNYQQGRDTTPLGYLRGMVNNTQPSIFDTNSSVDANGRPGGAWPIIFSIGGPGINAVTHYYESTSNVSDQAPIMFGYNGTYFYWMFTSNGTKVPGSEILQSSTAVPPGTSDVFVIQVLHDADGRLVVLMYGTRYTGTWAAAEYFKFIVYPTIASWTNSYYIVQWTDAASGTSANMLPDSGDTYTILAQG